MSKEWALAIGISVTATRMLEKTVREFGLSVESLAAVLDAVHQEGVRSPTLYIVSMLRP